MLGFGLVGVEEDEDVELASNLLELALIHLLDIVTLLLIKSDRIRLVKENLLVDLLCIVCIDVRVVQ